LFFGWEGDEKSWEVMGKITGNYGEKYGGVWGKFTGIFMKLFLGFRIVLGGFFCGSVREIFGVS